MYNRYGDTRISFLKEHRKELYKQLVESNQLEKHIMDLQEEIDIKQESLRAIMMENEGVTEELKFSDMLKWVGMMNNIQSRLTEIMMSTMVCV